MCALTIAPPSSSPDSSNDPSWCARATRIRVKPPQDEKIVSLSFRDLRVNAADLTSIGAAFARCSAEDMLGAVMRHEAGWRIPVDAVGSRAHHMLLGKIAGALDAMRTLTNAASALSPSREGIVGPLFRFATTEGGTGLEPRVGAVVLSGDDAARIRECLSSGLKRVCTWDALRTLRCDADAPSIPERLSPEALRRAHSILARMPWERVLALPLWLPSDLTEEERRAVLAKVFWSMTYRGFTQGDAQPSSWDVRLGDEAGRNTSVGSVPWPVDPVLGVLDHNCWIDTLEAWQALFASISSSETRL